jgi:hypothetical protein
MKYRFKLLITISALLCLSLAAVALAANTKKTLYLDGVYVADSNENTSGLTWPNPRITIGSEGGSDYLYNEYIGKMDEFAIYGGVLAASRIAAHYNARTSNVAYTAAVQADSPLLWLRFEDASTANGATAKNSGSIGIDGTYVTTGGSAIAQVTGINAGSLAINIPDRVTADGTGHCVDVGDGNGDFGEKLNGDVTVELWVNFSDTNDYPRFFQHNHSWDTTGGYGLMVNGPNQVGVIGGDATNYMGLPYDINDGQWHQIVVTYDSTYGKPQLPSSQSYVEEVKADHPVLWLRFEDVKPKDYSGNDHWVGYGGGTSIVEKVGGIGKSAYLSGSGYGAAATNDQNAPPSVGGSYQVHGDQYAFAPNDITFELWYKTLPPNQPQPEQYAIFFQQIGSWQNEPNGPAVSNSGGQFRVFGGSGAWYTGVGTAFDQKWHHLVVTYDEKYKGEPNMYAQLYLDGKFKKGTTFTGTKAKLGVELSHILVGAENDIGNTYNHFAGYIDEFAIYKGILDPNRILIHYSAWQPKNCADIRERGPLPAYAIADKNGDCVINFYDYALFALDWLLCNDPASSDPACIPNW